MKRWFVLVLFLAFGYTARAQLLVTTFIDPCTKEVKLITVPLVGSTVVTLYNKSASFTATDVQLGVLSQWINQAYIEWSSRNPCSTNQASTTATQVAAGTVSSVVSNALSAPPPTPTPAASGGESSSSSSSTESSSGGGESKEESKSESKGKGGAKAARMNPMLLSSDFTVAQNLDLSVNAIVSTGVSQSSMAGDESYGGTAMIWSNLKQFAFNARYTKMKFKDGSLESINNFSYTWAYSYGTKMGVLGFAHIRPLGKYGVAGINLSQITIGLPHIRGFYTDGTPDMTVQHAFLFSFTGFYTKSIKLNNRWNVSPEMYITNNPFMWLNREHIGIKDHNLNFLSGFSADMALTKRFKINTSIKTSFSTLVGVPILFNFLIGSKINI
jgi:hypothetical protein